MNIYHSIDMLSCHNTYEGFGFLGRSTPGLATYIFSNVMLLLFHLVKKILTFWRLLRTFLSVRTFLFGMLFFSTPGWLHMLVEWNDLLIQNQCDHSIHSWAIIAVFWCLLYTTFSCCNTWTRVGLFRNV